MKITHPHDKIMRRFSRRFWGSIGEMERFWGGFWDRIGCRFWGSFNHENEVTK